MVYVLHLIVCISIRLCMTQMPTTIGTLHFGEFINGTTAMDNQINYYSLPINNTMMIDFETTTINPSYSARVELYDTMMVSIDSWISNTHSYGPLTASNYYISIEILDEEHNNYRGSYSVQVSPILYGLNECMHSYFFDNSAPGIANISRLCER